MFFATLRYSLMIDMKDMRINGIEILLCCQIYHEKRRRSEIIPDLLSSSHKVLHLYVQPYKLLVYAWS